MGKDGPWVLRRIAREGRIPFVFRIGNRWFLTQRSVTFLRKFYSPEQREQMKGWGGTAQVTRMARFARRLDKACDKRQREWRREQRRRKKEQAAEQAA